MMALVDPEQEKLLKKKRKYHNRPATVNGIWFSSEKEADRWKILKAMEKNGNIMHLQRQQTFKLVVNGRLITQYRCDFRYFDIELEEDVVEDTKGVRTELYKIKARLMLALFGIKVKES